MVARILFFGLCISVNTSCGGNDIPARIVAGTADTVIINNIRAVRIPVRVTDASGNTLADSAVRFTRLSGDTLSIGESGTVTCTRSADVIVKAAIGKIGTKAILYCRPVEKVRIEAPIQFVMPGDSAQQIKVQAFDATGNPVVPLSAAITIRDTAVATIEGDRVIPRSPGASVIGVRVGNRDAGAGVHVYQRVSTLDGIRREQRLVAIPLEMSPGESHTWHLGAGGWMISMLPENDEKNGIRLRIDGASCYHGFTPRRYECATRSGATVVVYHPSPSGTAPTLKGYLLVRRFDD